ncbi:maltose permease [Plectosphaerella plurivora]|uniref:Maltose permease n=1 Tax=Plectosphaerella plurivora TaxID=936078 RepID=A0A9P8V9R8_9PEZI|nr:maltose permease [Plectosphaerella plurivora]
MDAKSDNKPAEQQPAALEKGMAAAESNVVESSSADHKLRWADIWENKRVLGFTLLIYLLPINFGYEVTTLGKLLAVTPFARRFGYQVGQNYVISATNQQILNAANTIGIFCSAFATGFISDFIGRKRTIIVACIVCAGGVIMQFFSTSIMMLFGGKIIATLGFGLGHSLGPVFVAELAPVKIRGVCLALINTMIVTGQWLNSVTVLACKGYDNDMAWRIPLITQIIPPALLLIGLTILPESPSWLLIKGRREEAAKAFKRYNGPNFDADGAIAITESAIEKEQHERRQQKGSRWLDCFRGSNGRRTMIIVMVYLSQQTIGVNFVGGYLTYYFRLAGVNDPLAIGQVAHAVQFAGNIMSWPLVDRLGRRPMIVGGSCAMTALLLVIGGISTIGTPSALSGTVALMVIWGFMYHATLGAVAYTIGGETASVELRQKTYSINIMVSTAASCVVSQVMPYLINTDQANLGGKVCFIFFGASLPVCIWLWFKLPELKGRNYAEIQEMFNRNIPSREFKNYKLDMDEFTVEEKQQVIHKEA